MTEFSRADLSNARFTRTDLTGAEFRESDLSRSRFHGADLTGVTMRGVELIDVEITGELHNVTVNGVDIAPLVDAELDRRHPHRAAMRPEDPPGFRAAWTILDDLWSGTIERARALEPALLHESVNGEWSFIETLRHLAFATDAWIRRAILGDPSPWDPLDLPWDGMQDTPGIPRDRTARPTLAQTLELRESRRQTVREVIDALSEESLNASTTPVEAPGWPHPRSYPVRECLRIILNEEWEHRLYAERDLALLANKG